MLEFLLELLLDPGGLFDDWRDRRRERRIDQLARAAQIRCALRVAEGVSAGLGRRWRLGVARVPPGTLVFHPDSRWRAQRTVPVGSAVVLRPPADLPRRAARALGPEPRLIVLESAGAILEWVVPEAQVERAMRVTRRSVRTSGRTGPPPRPQA